MHIPEGDPMVLVTGATGYIATHVIQLLQQQGYRVRGTVRSLENKERISPIHKLCPDSRVPIQLVEADLCNEKGWLEAVDGCTYVIHTAGPSPTEQPDEQPRDETEMIKPAVDGIQNLMTACHAAGGVKRFIFTGSCGAIYGQGGDKLFTEEDWANPEARKLVPFFKSKILSEQLAWDLHNRKGTDMELVVLNLPLVLGPVLCSGLPASTNIIKRIMLEKYIFPRKINFSLVDVRDAAAAHVLALTSKEAAGKRIIVSSHNIFLIDMAKIVADEFMPQGYCISTLNMSYNFFWFASFLSRDISKTLPYMGKMKQGDNARMKEIFDISPIPIKETILEMVYGMIESGTIEKSQKYKGQPKVV
jgi:nucleoside-diphosphate-sugar epimerase